jgi:hypothetical protein
MTNADDNIKWFHNHCFSTYNWLETAVPMVGIATFTIKHIKRLCLSAKLPVNRQSETSLGKGKKGGKILTLQVEGFQNLQKHVEGFQNLLKKQLELINK